MTLREGLIAARGQILWILLLLLSSVWILQAEPDAPPPPATDEAP